MVSFVVSQIQRSATDASYARDCCSVWRLLELSGRPTDIGFQDKLLCHQDCSLLANTSRLSVAFRFTCLLKIVECFVRLHLVQSIEESGCSVPQLSCMRIRSHDFHGEEIVPSHPKSIRSNHTFENTHLVHSDLTFFTKFFNDVHT